MVSVGLKLGNYGPYNISLQVLLHDHKEVVRQSRKKIVFIKRFEDDWLENKMLISEIKVFLVMYPLGDIVLLNFQSEVSLL